MRITQASFEILPRDEKRGGMSIIELAGRTCYKSAPGLSSTSAENFVRRLAGSGHLSVMEHGDMIFDVTDAKIGQYLEDSLRSMRYVGKPAPMLTHTCIGGRHLVSGNMRAWMELFKSADLVSRYFIGHFDPAYTEGCYDADAQPDNRVRQLRYIDLDDPAERRAHIRQTVRFIVDRGVSHEFVRHRVMSFSQESTRYCNYAKDKFGHEIAVIEPLYLVQGTDAYGAWRTACEEAERQYFAMLDLGCLPEEARAVLPTSTRTELIMTGTLGQWDHFFDLRARQVTGKAHPQAAEVAVPLMRETARRYPDVIRG